MLRKNTLKLNLRLGYILFAHSRMCKIEEKDPEDKSVILTKCDKICSQRDALESFHSVFTLHINLSCLLYQQITECFTNMIAHRQRDYALIEYWECKSCKKIYENPGNATAFIKIIDHMNLKETIESMRKYYSVSEAYYFGKLVEYGWADYANLFKFIISKQRKRKLTFYETNLIDIFYIDYLTEHSCLLCGKYVANFTWSTESAAMHVMNHILEFRKMNNIECVGINKSKIE